MTEAVTGSRQETSTAASALLVPSASQVRALVVRRPARGGVTVDRRAAELEVNRPVISQHRADEQGARVFLDARDDIEHTEEPR